MSAPRSVTEKLVDAHLVSGTRRVGEEIALRIDQTLTQDATGTLVMLTLEAMGLERTRAELSAQYVDHNVIQADHRNADDHLFLLSACRRFGIWFSGAGNGVSHPVHMQRFGKPGKTLLGSDSHTCAAGSLGMLAIGAGGLDVALAMAAEPYFTKMPAVWGVRLEGRLPTWVSAKDVILEMLRRHGVAGGRGRIIEYYGPGLAALSAMDRHVIANMGAELGATTTVFPSDRRTRNFFERHRRDADFEELVADEGARYDIDETIDLSSIEPLIAKPSSPGNVVPVREVAGTPIYQSYIGSSANPGFRDFAVAACMVRGKRTAPGVSFDINPTSRQLLVLLARQGLLEDLVAAGARLHQAGCNGCIGMGQAPATGRHSLRTVPRNFPGRSGTHEDCVWLCSPETAAASALTGKITDPRELGEPRFEVPEPERSLPLAELLEPPASGAGVEIVKGPDIVSIPQLDALPDQLETHVLMQLGDDISTDEILPAGARVLPYRSNIPGIAQFCFDQMLPESEPSYARQAEELLRRGAFHAVVAGANYGQGSSREHAALAPRYLGLRLVIARSFARIHRDNLINYGVLPLTFRRPADRERIARGDTLRLADARALPRTMVVRIAGKGEIEVTHDFTERDIEALRAGSKVNWARQRLNR